MSDILKAIQQWAHSSKAPAWQHEAMIRLLQNGELTAADDADLWAILKSGRGIDDELKRQARSFGPELVPPAKSSGGTVKMTAISSLKHVNALAENSSLELAAEGLTAVYGGNGAGKSGYARVLKKACRARDRDDPIIQNANRPQQANAVATAIFRLEIDGVSQEVAWRNDQAAHDALGAFAVFDARCARHYIDEKGDTVYAPYGMDVLQGVASACGRLRSLLTAEQKSAFANTSAFEHLTKGETSVAKLLAHVSVKTNGADVERLATLSDEERAQHALLLKAVNEPDPKVKAKQLRLRAQLLLDLAHQCDACISPVKTETTQELRRLVDESNVAKAAATLASGAFRASYPLPGTGGEEWAALFEAARAFAVVAYPNAHFPALSPNDPCPLCQQPLGEQTARLLAFDQFVQNETEKTFKEKHAAARAAFKVLSTASFVLNCAPTTRAEVIALDAALMEAIETLPTLAERRRDLIKKACANEVTWEGIPELPASPSVRLTELSSGSSTEAEALETMTDEKAAAATRDAFNELDMRVKLGAVKAAVLDAIAVAQRAERLRLCEQDLRSNVITLKVGELNEKIVTPALAEALKAEFNTLGVSDLEVQLRSVNERGKTVYHLVLQRAGSAKPGAILSEGELRAVSIASFMADLTVSGSGIGIIFDDPVSSLDHIRRQKLVERLVEEAKKRQVIVLTHDVYFLFLLQQAAKERAIACAVRSLRRTKDGYGVPSDAVPFNAASTTTRISMLRNRAVEAARYLRDGDQETAATLVQAIYGDLRKTWERAVEEVLLNDVVVRFRPGVETQKLKAVEVTDDDVKTITSAMTECSKFPHDSAAIADVAIPTPDDVAKHIDNLESWRKSIDARNKATQKKRS